MSSTEVKGGAPLTKEELEGIVPGGKVYTIAMQLLIDSVTEDPYDRDGSCHERDEETLLAIQAADAEGSIIPPFSPELSAAVQGFELHPEDFDRQTTATFPDLLKTIMRHETRPATPSQGTAEH